ncbi:MAG: hypothetical protein Q9170_007866 [Blastenia crenularia]
MAAPSPAERQYQLEHIHDDQSPKIIIAFGICLSIATITVLLRFVARHLARAPLGGDDWTILVGLVRALGNSKDLVQCTEWLIRPLSCISYGLGRHAVLITNLAAMARGLNASIIFYITSLLFTKISILLLYRRIFPSRKFHVILWALGIFIFAFSTVNVFVILFQCNPVKAGFNPLIKGRCIDSETMILVVAILTVVTDFVILGLPLPLVWKLQMRRTRKIQVSLIFLLGTFASVVSIYRATQITTFDRQDLSYASIKRSIWSGVENCAAIVCANMATLRPILKYVFADQTISTGKLGTASQGTTAAIRNSYRRRWTWRKAPPLAAELGNDGRFHRLNPQSTDDVEKQKIEKYMLSAIASPRVPDTAHF